MRQRIARIVDPFAWSPALARVLPGIAASRQRAALSKADQILAIEFDWDELPPELQRAAEIFDEARDREDGGR